MSEGEGFKRILPLRDVVVYPHVIIALNVTRTSSMAVIDSALEQGEEILLLPQKDARVEAPQKNDFYKVGTLGRVVQSSALSGDVHKVLVEGVRRVHVVDIVQKDAGLMASFRPMKERFAQSELSLSYAETLIEEFSRYLKNQHRNADELIEMLKMISDAGRVADTVVAHMDVAMKERVQILRTSNIETRLEKVFSLLEEQEGNAQLERKIRGRVNAQMNRNQQAYYLREKMKVIEKELMEISDDDENFSDANSQLEKAIKSAKMPEAVEKKALEELARLRQMSAMSSEATVSRSYLEWLIKFPWQKSSKTLYDLERAENILERDHYGLEDVKARIIEYLAVQRRKKDNKSPIICLVGPPGVGKTSLGKSIAEAMGRDFERIALGGVRDEAEIRGHRRTYIGALPGKIVQKLCKVGHNNPVILLDEIDKMGQDHRGDPASALLEVLDPAQNHKFNDHYFEEEVDLSKVMFIATANTLNIPAPLLDRMEVIRLSGYTPREKEEIAKRYLLPRQSEENGLKKGELTLKEETLNRIIEDYTREAGVRHLEREIGKLARKAVYKIDSGAKKSFDLSASDLEEFLGVAKFKRNPDDLSDKVGSVTGLAWTSVGGELLQIETSAFKGKGKLIHTGQLGDVMKESVQTALSLVRQYLERHNPEFSINDYDLHLHLPEGAVPKDGPSAGIAIATAFLSALTQQPVRGDLAMTGEISLHGNVLTIGGLKEKLLAAQRSGIKTVLIPEHNVKDLQDVPQEIKDSLEIMPVKRVEEVFAHAFVDKDALKQGTLFSPPFAKGGHFAKGVSM